MQAEKHEHPPSTGMPPSADSPQAPQLSRQPQPSPWSPARLQWHQFPWPSGPMEQLHQAAPLPHPRGGGKFWALQAAVGACGFANPLLCVGTAKSAARVSGLISSGGRVNIACLVMLAASSLLNNEKFIASTTFGNQELEAKQKFLAASSRENVPQLHSVTSITLFQVLWNK